jgi:hypothetical protein
MLHSAPMPQGSGAFLRLGHWLAPQRGGSWLVTKSAGTSGPQT